MRFTHRFGALLLAFVTAALTIGPAAAVDAGIADYEIEVSLDPDTHRLQASERIRWTNTTATPTEEIYLHLYLNAFASSETTFMRELGGSSLRSRVALSDGWGWVRIERMVLDDGADLMPKVEFMRPDDGNADDFTVARVALPRVVEPGGVVEIDLEFSAQLPRIIARTGVTSFTPRRSSSPTLARTGCRSPSLRTGSSVPPGSRPGALRRMADGGRSCTGQSGCTTLHGARRRRI